MGPWANCQAVLLFSGRSSGRFSLEFSSCRNIRASTGPDWTEGPDWTDRSDWTEGYGLEAEGSDYMDQGDWTEGSAILTGLTGS